MDIRTPLERKNFKETLFDTYGQEYAIDEVVFLKPKDPNDPNDWEILIFKNKKFGTILTMDGTVQLTTFDEANYHEMMVHVPLLAHRNPKHVLIVGGGDGGILREVVKHPGVEKITLVEISEDVVNLSKKYLPTVSNGAFDDPRVTVVYADGNQFVKDTQEKFDVIITDSTDAIGPGAVLFSEEYYAACKQCLNPNSIMVTQNGSASLQEEQIRNTHQRLSNHHQDVSFYSAQVPTYPGGQMYFGWGTDDPTLRQLSEETIRQRYENRSLNNLSYYNPGIHAAAFKLPQFVLNMIQPKKPLLNEDYKGLASSLTKGIGCIEPVSNKPAAEPALSMENRMKNA